MGFRVRIYHGLPTGSIVVPCWGYLFRILNISYRKELITMDRMGRAIKSLQVGIHGCRARLTPNTSGCPQRVLLGLRA